MRHINYRHKILAHLPRDVPHEQSQIQFKKCRTKLWQHLRNIETVDLPVYPRRDGKVLQNFAASVWSVHRCTRWGRQQRDWTARPNRCCRFAAVGLSRPVMKRMVCRNYRYRGWLTCPYFKCTNKWNSTESESVRIVNHVRGVPVTVLVWITGPQSTPFKSPVP